MTDTPVAAADVLHDATLALLAAGLDATIVRRELAAVRQRWQGQSYIRSIDPERDSFIKAALDAGETPRQIAKQAGCHRTTIQRKASRWLR